MAIGFVSRNLELALTFFPTSEPKPVGVDHGQWASSPTRGRILWPRGVKPIPGTSAPIRDLETLILARMLGKVRKDLFVDLQGNGHRRG